MPATNCGKSLGIWLCAFICLFLLETGSTEGCFMIMARLASNFFF